jgi:putative SOS response-associated peptidase YedK
MAAPKFFISPERYAKTKFIYREASKKRRCLIPVTTIPERFDEVGV